MEKGKGYFDGWGFDRLLEMHKHLTESDRYAASLGISMVSLESVFVPIAADITPIFDETLKAFVRSHRSKASASDPILIRSGSSLYRVTEPEPDKFEIRELFDITEASTIMIRYPEPVEPDGTPSV